ncbi:MAG: hypothetical protein ACK4NC_06020 [Candidatus Gracilibacteria bacterium]
MHILHKKTLFIITLLTLSTSIFATPMQSTAQSTSDGVQAGAYYDLSYATENPSWISGENDLRIVYPERAPKEGYTEVGTTAFIKKEILAAKTTGLKYFILPLTVNNTGIAETQAFSRMKSLLNEGEFRFIPQFALKDIILFQEQWKTAVSAISGETTLFKSASAGIPVYISYDFNTATPEERSQLSTLLKDPAYAQLRFYAVSDLFKTPATTTAVAGLSGTGLSSAVNGLIQESALFPCDKEVYGKAFNDIENLVYANGFNPLSHCSISPVGGGSTEYRLFNANYFAQYLKNKPVISERANTLVSLGFKGVIGDKYLPWVKQTSSWVYYETFRESAVRLWNSALKLKPGIPVFPSMIVAHDSFYMENSFDTTVMAGSPKLYESLLDTVEAIFQRTYPEGYLVTAGDWNNYKTGNLLLPTKTYGTAYIDLLTSHLR